MEKFFNNIDNQEKCKLAEKKLLTEGEKYQKSFSIQIISNDIIPINTKMNIDKENNTIIFITEDSRIIINVKSQEIIGFIPPEHIPDEFKHKYRKAQSELDEDHKLALFNFYPKYEYNRCNCWGWLRCSCTEKVSINKPKVKFPIIC